MFYELKISIDEPWGSPPNMNLNMNLSVRTNLNGNGEYANLQTGPPLLELMRIKAYNFVKQI